MTDPERIWLQNADDARATGDRLWCQDKVWPECDEQQEPTEYIRADLYASRISQQDAELERLWREVEELRDAKWQAKHVDTMNDIASLRIALEGAEAALAEARKAAFIEVAEMAALSSSPSVYAFAAMIRAKAEETRI